MAADRRIGAAGEARLFLDQRLVERVAHAVQALEFVALRVARPLQDGGDGERVVRGELRVDHRPRREQLVGAGDVVEVGHRLAGEHRIAGEPALLRALHLGVPVGALDEAHHQLAVERPGEVGDPVDHLGRALLVGLDGEAEAVPARERGIGQHGGDDVERQFEPVRLLRVDGEVEIVALGLLRQAHDHRHQLAHHPLLRQGVVARVQRGELHRDAGAVRQGLVAGGLADGVDRVGIGLGVALGVVLRARALAEHVEGIAEQAALSGAGAVQRLADGLAEHEMAAEHPHRLPRGGADGGHADALGQRAQDALGRLAGLDDARRDAERPGRGGDEEGVRAGLVVDEVALADLVLDQPVGGGGIGHAQQRFGQHHQRQALAGRQRIFAQQLLDAAEPARPASGSPRSDRVARLSIRASRSAGRPAPASRRRAIAASSGA